MPRFRSALAALDLRTLLWTANGLLLLNVLILLLWRGLRPTPDCGGPAQGKATTVAGSEVDLQAARARTQAVEALERGEWDRTIELLGATGNHGQQAAGELADLQGIARALKDRPAPACAPAAGAGEREAQAKSCLPCPSGPESKQQQKLDRSKKKKRKAISRSP